ncbi:MAG: hypothetical protein ACREP9_23235, partial [Candidatus Dormibacteraceae bacterium]
MLHLGLRRRAPGAAAGNPITTSEQSESLKPVEHSWHKKTPDYTDLATPDKSYTFVPPPVSPQRY